VDQRFCSNRCGHRWHRREVEAKKTPEERWSDRRRANHQKRRAAKKAAAVGALVLLADIRERDGGRCKICGGLVNGKPWPHPLSASLDHIVPLSKGGSHDPANVQLAHLRCNISKGNRGGGEQLRLVG
jgi:5-methylcytosine-specific restriction endonuclease McrA